MIEKERKFLLKEDYEFPKLLEWIDIQQGYLMINKKDHLRVRIVDNESGYIAYKYGEDPSNRLEFEYHIPIHEARLMMQLTNIIVSKKRTSINYMGNRIDVDEYPDGTKVVEIEYEYELTKKQIPNFCGKEITGDSEYSNISIALRNAGDA